ncbi:hypothetical protein WJX84_010722 [Apatococcus fuscideae]|uniref:K Homology domain-containing protein n=1 Tax=Apatococcus fuscideae TaxID=2026836 RepID=A0AAW1T026_9CHLO
MVQHSAVVECPKSMVGRVIGKGGETIKALQQYTGAVIQVDQSREPTRVTISGTTRALTLASSMVQDIVAGQFKGFAMLRSVARSSGQPKIETSPAIGHTNPVYVEGYGFVPPSQDTSALLGGHAGDSGLYQRRGGPAPSSMFGSSPLSQLARLRLEAVQPAAQQQLQQQLFAGLDHMPTPQYDTALQSQQLLQQLQLLLLQQQQQQQRAQQAISLSEAMPAGEIRLPSNLASADQPAADPSMLNNHFRPTSSPHALGNAGLLDKHLHIKTSPQHFESAFLPATLDSAAVDSRSDSVESSYSAFGLPAQAYGHSTIGGLAASSLPAVKWG